MQGIHLSLLGHSIQHDSLWKYARTNRTYLGQFGSVKRISMVEERDYEYQCPGVGGGFGFDLVMVTPLPFRIFSSCGVLPQIYPERLLDTILLFPCIGRAVIVEPFRLSHPPRWRYYSLSD